MVDIAKFAAENFRPFNVGNALAVPQATNSLAVNQ